MEQDIAILRKYIEDNPPTDNRWGSTIQKTLYEKKRLQRIVQQEYLKKVVYT